MAVRVQLLKPSERVVRATLGPARLGRMGCDTEPQATTVERWCEIAEAHRAVRVLRELGRAQRRRRSCDFDRFVCGEEPSAAVGLNVRFNPSTFPSSTDIYSHWASQYQYNPQPEHFLSCLWRQKHASHRFPFSRVRSTLANDSSVKMIEPCFISLFETHLLLARVSYARQKVGGSHEGDDMSQTGMMKTTNYSTRKYM